MKPGLVTAKHWPASLCSGCDFICTNDQQRSVCFRQAAAHCSVALAPWKVPRYWTVPPFELPRLTCTLSAWLYSGSSVYLGGASEA